MADLEDIKKIREKTGASVMGIKQALEEAGGNSEKANEIIKKKGLAKASEKAHREIKAGIVKTYTHNDRVGVVLKVGCETDFVARSEPFQQLVHNLAVHIVAMNPANVEELMAQPFVKDENTSVENLVKEAIAKTGENIKIDEFYRLEL